MTFSRRNFIAKVGIAALGAAAAGSALSSCSPQGGGGATGSSIGSDDAEIPVLREVDILVIGCGLAGYSAGISAIEAGISPESILLIDKETGEGSDYAGSSLVMSGNYLYASEDSASGIEAFAQAMYDITNKCQNMDLIQTLAENANAGLQWLIDHGCEFGDDVSVGGGTSYEAASTRNMEVPTATSLRSSYENLGGQTEWSCRAVSLTTGGNGVDGAICDTKDGMGKITAKQVILATGGMLSSGYWKELLFGEFGSFIYSRAPEFITGDGFSLAEGVGGVLAPLSHGKKSLYAGVSYPGIVSPMMSTVGRMMAPYSVVVNLEGERFVNEMTLGTQSGALKLLDVPKCTIGVVSDSSQTENLQECFAKCEEQNVPTYTFDTLDEVAELFGCSADALKGTIDQFNASIAGDRTEGLEVNKTANAAPISTPPYYAWFPLTISASFTGAGLQITTNAQATYADGTPIAGLYAAGEVAGGIAYEDYFHGCNHTKAVVFGRIAGEQAASKLS